MNILVLQQCLVMGGRERVLISYLQLWQQLGWQIDLYIMYDLGADNFFQDQIPHGIPYQFIFSQDDQTRLEQIRRQKAQRRKHSLWYKIDYELFKRKEKMRLYGKLNRIINQKKYDAVIDFSGEYLDGLDRFIRLPEWLRGRIPPTIRWIHGDLNGNKPLTPKKHRTYQRIFKNHTCNICLTPAMQETLHTLFPDLSGKFHVLPNPIQLEDIHAQAEQPLPALPFNPQDTPYLLQVARLSPEKGHEELIHIFKTLKNDHHIPHKLLFIGDGPNRSELQKLIDDLDLHHDCLLLGANNNPYPLFRHADIFVHTAEHEGLPTVLLESMACGTPIVAMDCPNGPKFILGANSEHGYLIPMHDRTAFADAVVRLLKYPEQHQHYCEQGLKRVQYFSMESIGKQLTELMQKLLNQH